MVHSNQSQTIHVETFKRCALLTLPLIWCALSFGSLAADALSLPAGSVGTMAAARQMIDQSRGQFVHNGVHQTGAEAQYANNPGIACCRNSDDCVQRVNLLDQSPDHTFESVPPRDIPNYNFVGFFGSRLGRGGNATLVSPPNSRCGNRFLITNAHLAFDTHRNPVHRNADRTPIAQEFEYCPKSCRSRRPNGCFKAKRMELATLDDAVAEDGSFARTPDDLAFIELEDPVCSLPAVQPLTISTQGANSIRSLKGVPFGLNSAAIYRDDTIRTLLSQNRTARLSQRPAGRTGAQNNGSTAFEGYSFYRGSGRLMETAMHGRLLRYEISSAPGGSGSPLWNTGADGQKNLIGIQTQGGGPDQVNVGVAITPAVVERFNLFLPPDCR